MQHLTVMQVDHSDRPVWDVQDEQTKKVWSVSGIDSPTPLVISHVGDRGRIIKASGPTGSKVIAAVRRELAP